MFAFLIEFFATGVGFTLGLFMASLVCCLSLDKDHWITSTISTGLAFYLIMLHQGISFSDIITHPILAVEFFLGYLIVGLLWSFGKWYFLLKGVIDRYRIVKDRFLTSKQLADDSFLDNTTGYISSHQELFAHLLSEEFSRHIPSTSTRNELLRRLKPAAQENKARITSWIAFWPWSFVWTMLNDPLKKLINFIFYRIKSLYNKMADKIFAGEI